MNRPLRDIGYNDGQKELNENGQRSDELRHEWDSQVARSLGRRQQDQERNDLYGNMRRQKIDDVQCPLWPEGALIRVSRPNAFQGDINQCRREEVEQEIIQSDGGTVR